MVPQQSPLLTAEDIRRALDRMAAEIIERNRGLKRLGLIGIRTRGEFLASRLRDLMAARADEGEVIPVGVLDATIYRDDYDPMRTAVRMGKTEVPFPVDDLHIVMVDDVLYTGRTARAAMTGVMALGRPSLLTLAVLVDRGGRELPIRADFVGKTVATSREERVKVLLEEIDGRDEVLLVRA